MPARNRRPPGARTHPDAQGEYRQAGQGVARQGDAHEGRSAATDHPGKRRRTSKRSPGLIRESLRGLLYSRTRRLLTFLTEPAHEVDDEAYQQNQAKPAAADDGTAKVKSAAAEQEKQNNHE